MKIISTDSTQPLNTHAVAVSGVALGLIGLIVPPVLHWAFPHIPIDVQTAINHAGQILVTVGVGGAYAGRPMNVPQPP